MRQPEKEGENVCLTFRVEADLQFFQRMYKYIVASVAVLVALLVVGSVADIDDPLPGIDFLSLGYLSFADEWGQPVQDFSYKRGLTMRNPFDKDRYQVPDQIPSNGIQTAQAFYSFKQEVRYLL